MSISKVDAAQGLSKAIQECLDDYLDDVEEKTDGILHSVANGCAKNLKSTSPVGQGTAHPGRYAKGWSVKKFSQLRAISKIGSYVVHNRTDWQLTHLLENGHVIKNRKNGPEYGRTDPKPHIANAEKEAIDKCLKDLEAQLK